MKKVLSIILDIILVLAVSFVIIGMAVRPVCAETITRVFIEGAVSSGVLDEVYGMFPDITIEQLGQIEEGIKQDENLKELAGDYLDAMADAAVNDTAFQAPDVSAYMEKVADDNMELAEEALGVELKGFYKVILKEVLSASGTQIENQITAASENILSSRTTQQKIIFWLYKFMTSEGARIAALIAAAVSGVAIILLRFKKGRFLFHLGLCGISAGVMTGVLLPVILNRIAWSITNQILGRTADISLAPLSGRGTAVLTAGAVLFILYWIQKLVLSGRSQG